MNVRFLPGVNRTNLLDTLRGLESKAKNLRGGGGSGIERSAKYQQWATEAARMLQGILSPQDIDRLVFTPGYSRIVSWAALLSIHGDQASLNHLLNNEMDLCVARFTQLHEDFVKDTGYWAADGALVVMDTNVYLRHPKPAGDEPFDLRKIDFVELTGIYREPIRLIFPIAIVDELDNLKQHSDAHVKWRAGHTLGVLDETVRWPYQRGTLVDADFNNGPPRRRVTAEIVLDPPGHTRLPITDDEIVDRALAIEAMAGRKVWLVTYDTGMATRARQAGLTVVKKTIDPGHEPAPRQPRAPHQQQRR